MQPLPKRIEENSVPLRKKKSDCLLIQVGSLKLAPSSTGYRYGRWSKHCKVATYETHIFLLIVWYFKMRKT
jgi:hypothetical protein